MKKEEAKKPLPAAKNNYVNIVEEPDPKKANVPESVP